MAWSTPRTWTTGELVTAAHLNQEVRDNLAAAHPLGVDAWTPYTPTLTQSGAVTKTVTYAKYQRVGRLIHFAVNLSITGTGTASNVVLVGLPVAASAGFDGCQLGPGLIYDSSASTVYNGNAAVVGTTTAHIWPAADGAVTALGGRAFTAALASGDLIRMSGTYEAAS